MAEAKWGRKRICLGCQAAFYDMRRDPITCPKCGIVHEPVALLKSDGRPPRRSRASRPATVESADAPAAADSGGPANDDAAAEAESDDDAELVVAEEEEFEADEAEESKA